MVEPVRRHLHGHGVVAAVGGGSASSACSSGASGVVRAPDSVPMTPHGRPAASNIAASRWVGRRLAVRAGDPDHGQVARTGGPRRRRPPGPSAARTSATTTWGTSTGSSWSTSSADRPGGDGSRARGRGRRPGVPAHAAEQRAAATARVSCTTDVDVGIARPAVRHGGGPPRRRRRGGRAARPIPRATRASRPRSPRRSGGTAAVAAAGRRRGGCGRGVGRRGESWRAARRGRAGVARTRPSPASTASGAGGGGRRGGDAHACAAA